MTAPHLTLVIAAVLATVGVLVTAWGAWRDRSRGRRRCPKCWYSLDGVPSLTCPECGKTHRTERRLFHTRRSRRLMVAGAALLMLAGATATTPAIISGGWVRYTPTPVLRLVLSFFKEDAEAAVKKAGVMPRPVIISWTSSALPANSSLRENLILRNGKVPVASGAFSTWGNPGPQAASASRPLPLTSWERLLVAYQISRQLDSDLATVEADPQAGPAADGDTPGLVLDPVCESILSLGRLGEEARPALGELARALQSPDSMIRDTAVMAHASLGVAAGPNVSRICRILRSTPRAETRIACLTLLAQLGDVARAATPLLLDLIHSSPELRLRAADALTSVAPSDPRTVDALIWLLSINQEDIRDVLSMLAAIAGSEGEMPLGETSRASAAATTQPAWISRARPVQPRAEVEPAAGAERATDALIATLAHQDPGARKHAAMFLAGLPGASDAQAAAIKDAILRETKVPVRHEEMHAHYRLRGPGDHAFLQLLVHDLDDLSSPARTGAAQLLAMYGPDAADAAPALAKCAIGAESDRAGACDALAAIGPTGWRELDQLVRRNALDTAAAALCKHNHEAACYVIAEVTDGDTRTRMIAARALNQCLYDLDVLQTLRWVTGHDTDAAVRAQASESLHAVK